MSPQSDTATSIARRAPLDRSRFTLRGSRFAVRARPSFVSHTPSFIHLHQSNSHHTTGIDKTLGFCRDVARARDVIAAAHARSTSSTDVTARVSPRVRGESAARVSFPRRRAPSTARPSSTRSRLATHARDEDRGSTETRAEDQSIVARERSCVENARDRGTNRDIDVIRARC